MGFLSFRVSEATIYRALAGYTSPLHLTSVVVESLDHLSSGGKHIFWTISDDLHPKDEEEWASFSSFLRGLEEAFEDQDDRLHCHFTIVFLRSTGGKRMIQITRLGQVQAKILPFRRKQAT